MAHPFVDETVIVVRSGAGGDGCVSFRREKYEPRGGPDGGDGGRGGHVVFVADIHSSTLLDLGRNHHHTAEKGTPGMRKNCTGRCGSDLRIKVPVGTLIRVRETGELLVDLAEADQEYVVVRGGAGGRGNKRFATSTHQTPREFESGGEAEVQEVAIELKLMADVGLLGLPNAGKSTFLSAVSSARPRIASYPFTTLRPQLGISELDMDRRLVIADIPGLVEGAHLGVGLGMEFLRHLERTRALVHLVDPFDRQLEEVLDDYRIIRDEIRNHVVDLSGRPIITVLTKADLYPPDEQETLRREFSRAVGEDVGFMSAATGRGVADLLDDLWHLVGAAGRD